MADDRTIAPSPARWRRAWRAGLRLRSRWAVPALAWGIVAVLVRAWSQGARPAVLAPRPGSIAPQDWLPQVAATLLTGWLVGAAVVLTVAVLTGQLGPIAVAERRRLRAAPHRPSFVARLGLVALLGAGLVAWPLGVLAGAARAVDASEAGLGQLWLGWAERGSAMLAIGLAAAAIVEVWLDRRERTARLHRSPQQVRDAAREAGSASR